MRLSHIVLPLAALAAPLAILGLPASHIRAEAGQKKLLVVTLTKGFRHSAIPTGMQVLAELGARSQSWTADEAGTEEDLKAKMSPEGLKQYDAVCFNNTTGELPIPDRDAFLQWIREGHGFVGMHAATDTFHRWPEYIDMIGAEFRTHGRQCEVSLRVLDRQHPANEKFPEGPWKITDEIYLLRKCQLAGVRHLLTMDTNPMDGAPDQGKPGWHMASWVKQYGQGRVFYTILGHREDVWRSQVFQDHITGGIQWAMGLKEADATPQALTGLWK